MKNGLMTKLDVTSESPIYSTKELRTIEAQAASLPLMERAGLAAAELARSLIPEKNPRVLVLAGPGNNGGDAFVLARHLKSWWHPVTVAFRADQKYLSKDAVKAYQAWKDCGGECVDTIPPELNFGLIVDGLFGIGLEREITSVYADWIRLVNNSGVPILAIDIPSGLESNSGRVMGTAIRANHTLTFISLKPGLLTLNGPDHCGEIHLEKLGLDAPSMLKPHGNLIKARLLSQAIKSRPLQSHKGDFGSVGILGGSPGMIGAAFLAGRAALKLGAGRVYVATLVGSPLDFEQIELMMRTPDELLKMSGLECLVIGPGLGMSPDALLWLNNALESNLSILLDADALNLISAHPKLQNLLKQRRTESILTPHPAEAGRLLTCTTTEVQNDRIAAALKLATHFHCHVVLKGTGTICANPEGIWSINISGNPGLSSAGSGDVLSGIIAALIAQGLALDQAIRCGVYLHGAAADERISWGVGPIGLTATELIDSARDVLNQNVKFHRQRQIRLEI